MVRCAAKLLSIGEAQPHNWLHPVLHDRDRLARNGALAGRLGGGAVRVDRHVLSVDRSLIELLEREQTLGRMHASIAREAGIRRVDPARVGARVPAVDHGVVLDTGVGAPPRGVGDLAHELTRFERLQSLARRPSGQLPLIAVLNRDHELVGHPDRVVRVLVLDRRERIAVEPHVEAGVAQRRRLLLLARLAPDEVLDIWVVDVEHDHLRRAPRLATRLDRPGPRVGAAHERHRPGGEPALRQRLLGGADVRQVDPRPGAAAEDHPLLGVPVEDRLYVVLDAEDEAGRALRLLFEADVEPHGAVEGRLLVQQDVGQLVLEGVGVDVAREVAALTAPRRDRPGDAADHLLHRVLALRRSELSTEVLLRDDVGRVLRPALRELDVALVERGVVGIADQSVAKLPLDLVEGADVGAREAALDAQSPRPCRCVVCSSFTHRSLSSKQL